MSEFARVLVAFANHDEAPKAMGAALVDWMVCKDCWKTIVGLQHQGSAVTWWRLQVATNRCGRGW
jgi:hypothetical protein